MSFRFPVLLLLFTFFTFVGFALTSNLAFATSKQDFSEEFKVVNWTELMPKDDLDALLNPPDYINQIADGSTQDTLQSLPELGSQGRESKDKKPDRFQQALVSTRVIETFGNKPVRLPGFIVPLQNDDAQQVTEFFIVPYFGACLHLPPPPPNQMIHVKYPQGITVQDLYTPFWFEGTLSIETNNNDLGTSAYAMTLKNAFIYEEE